MDVSMMSDELLYRLEARVAVITLNRPERLNALTKDMMQALRTRLRRVLWMKRSVALC